MRTFGMRLIRVAMAVVWIGGAALLVGCGGGGGGGAEDTVAPPDGQADTGDVANGDTPDDTAGGDTPDDAVAPPDEGPPPDLGPDPAPELPNDTAPPPEVDGGGDLAPDVAPDLHPDLTPDGGPDGGGDTDVAGPPATLVITEIMKDPCVVPDAVGEWIELTNVSAEAIDLRGLTLRDDDSDRHVITAAEPMLVAPGERVVLGASADPAVNGGVAVAYAYANFTLAQAPADEIVIERAGVLLDRVAYDVDTFPDARCASLMLRAEARDPRRNDLGDNWCVATRRYGQGDLGSPGSENPACEEPLLARCRLQGPAEFTGTSGTPLTAVGRVSAPGISDFSTGGDFSPLLVAEAGYGPVGSDPAGNDDWIWLAAAPDPEWQDGAEPGFDEYLVAFPLPAAGNYDLAYRFSRDGGDTFTLCDRDTGVEGEDGSENGYQAENAGRLTAEADPCAPNPCTVAPAEPTCDADGNTLLVYALPGACEATPEGHDCEYALERIDCTPDGGYCANGQCVPPVRPELEGDLLITEILSRPAGDEGLAEWIEIHNPGPQALNLDGCRLSDASVDDTLIDAGGVLLVPAGGFVVLGRSGDPLENGGLLPDHVYSGFILANRADEVLLTCGDTLIDGVAYDDREGWPAAPGRTMSLDPANLDATANDAPAAWCAAAEADRYGDERNAGTPGTANPTCPRLAVEWCRLQAPSAAAVLAGADVSVSGRVWAPGLTDLTAATDPDVRLQAEVGYGPRGSDPAGAGWVWLAAHADPFWTDVEEPDRDQYVEAVRVAAPGDYDLAYRFAVLGGPWLVCDRDQREAGGADGSADGYSAADAATLTVHRDPCHPVNPCTEPATAPHCSDDGTTLLAWALPGTCAIDATFAAVCSYLPRQIDCETVPFGACENDACVEPPLPYAPGHVLITEFMAHPLAVDDAVGEWIELYNNGPDPLRLQGCVLRDDTGDRHVLAAADGWLAFAPGSHLVLGVEDDPAQNGGVTVDYVYPRASFALGDETDGIVLECDGLLIDRLDYALASGWPMLAGAAVSLDPAFYDPLAADNPGFWCVPDVPYGPGGDTGTPGLFNPPCGEPSCDPNPCVHAPDPSCAGDEVVTYEPEGTCTIEFGRLHCEYAEAGRQDCAPAGRVCRNGQCQWRQPAPGEVVFSEIMADPALPLVDADAEWFEVQSLAAVRLTLAGCIVENAAGQSTVLTGPVIEPGRTALIMRSASDNGGLTPDALFSFELGDIGDILTLGCGPAGAPAEVDTVAYSGAAGFPLAAGRSLALDPEALDAAANDLGSSWCTGQSVYAPDGSGDNYGSPRVPNPSCAETTYEGLWCRLEFPLSLWLRPAATAPARARIWIDGLTDRTSYADTAPTVFVQVGVGARGSDPANWTRWAWAAPRPGFDAWRTQPIEPSNDEYIGQLEAPSELGTYDFAFRVTGDGGASFVYCDRSTGEVGHDGSEDGYQPVNAGYLVVTDD